MNRMPGWKIGLGPVFVVRVDHVVAALAGVRAAVAVRLVAARWRSVGIWMNTNRTIYASAIRYLAALGEGFFLAVIGTQLCAGAAGGPGGDGRRDLPGPGPGTLSHMLMTDLSAAEIVLGKLAGRLVPVLTMLACTLPVLLDPHPFGRRRSDCAALGLCRHVSALPCWVVRWRWLCRSGWGRRMKRSCARIRSGCSGYSPGRWRACWDQQSAGPGSRSRDDRSHFSWRPPYSWPGSVGFFDYLQFLAVTCSIAAVLIGVTILRLPSSLRTIKSAEHPAFEAPARGFNIWRISHVGDSLVDAVDRRQPGGPGASGSEAVLLGG